MEEKWIDSQPELQPRESALRQAPTSVRERVSSDERPVSAEGISTHDRENQVALLLSNASLLIKHKEMTSARTLVYKALSLNSSHPVALKMAVSFLNPKTEFRAISKIMDVLCQVDYCFENLAMRARGFYEAGEDKKALELYFEAMSIVVDAPKELFDVYKNVGNILTRDKDYDGAEEYYHKAFTLNPSSDTLMINLGTLAMQKQDWGSALQHFRQAVAQNSMNEKAWVGLALVHQAMADLPLAIGNLETALDINPENRTAVHLFSAWVIQLGQYQKAIERLQDFLSRTEVDKDLSLVLIQLFCQTNRLDLALLEIERLLLWIPNDDVLLQVEQEIRDQCKTAV